MKYSSRLWLYGPFALLALIAVAICVNWYFASNRLAEKFANWNGREMMPGVTLHYASVEMGGFPFRVDAVFKDFRVTVADKTGPAEWRAENFALHRLSYGKQTLFEAAGKQTLRWTDETGAKRELEFIPGSLQASAIEDKAGLTRFDLDIVGIGSKALTAARFQFHIRRDPKAPLLNIVAKGNDLKPSPEIAPLLSALKKGSYKADVTKSESFDGLRSGTMSWIDAQDKWRANKGEVHRTD